MSGRNSFLRELVMIARHIDNFGALPRLAAAFSALSRCAIALSIALDLQRPPSTITDE